MSAGCTADHRVDHYSEGSGWHIMCYSNIAHADQLHVTTSESETIKHFWSRLWLVDQLCTVCKQLWSCTLSSITRYHLSTCCRDGEGVSFLERRFMK